MLSNLCQPLRAVMPAEQARQLAAMIAALIDGVWLHAALSEWREADSEAARAMIAALLDSRFWQEPEPASAIRTSSTIACRSP